MTIPAKLPGTLISQYVKCGKPNCKCARGALHGPYWYRFWREDGYRLRKQYVRLADLEQVRAACQAYAKEVMAGRVLVRTGRHLAIRMAHPGDTPGALLDGLLATQAALWLMNELDDYFWDRRGTLQLRLQMFRLEEEFGSLAGEHLFRANATAAQKLLAHAQPAKTGRTLRRILAAAMRARRSGRRAALRPLPRGRCAGRRALHTLGSV